MKKTDNKIIQKIQFFMSKFKKNNNYKNYLEQQKTRSISKLNFSNKNEESKNRIISRKIDLLNIVSNNIKLQSINHALVIGCRDTTELDMLEKYGVIKTTGLDLFSNDKRVIIGDMQNMHMFQDESFDLIYCSHVLEHSYDIKKTIKEIHRVSKKPGFLVIEVPINFTANEFDIYDFKSSENLFSIIQSICKNAKILFSTEYKKEDIGSGTDIIRLIIQL